MVEASTFADTTKEVREDWRDMGRRGSVGALALSGAKGGHEETSGT